MTAISPSLTLFQAEYRGLVEYYRLAYNLHRLTDTGRGDGAIADQDTGSQTPAVSAKGVPQISGHLSRGKEVLQSASNRHRTRGQETVGRSLGRNFVTLGYQGTNQGSSKFLGPGRSELEKRLLADTCEYCGTTGDAERIEVHHIRALKDLKTYDGREKPAWVKIMAARKRKTLVLCATCHQDVTYGRPMRRKPKSVSRKG